MLSSRTATQFSGKLYRATISRVHRSYSQIQKEISKIGDTDKQQKKGFIDQAKETLMSDHQKRIAEDIKKALGDSRKSPIMQLQNSILVAAALLVLMYYFFHKEQDQATKK